MPSFWVLALFSYLFDSILVKPVDLTGYMGLSRVTVLMKNTFMDNTRLKPSLIDEMRNWLGFEGCDIWLRRVIVIG